MTSIRRHKDEEPEPKQREPEIKPADPDGPCPKCGLRGRPPGHH